MEALITLLEFFRSTYDAAQGIVAVVAVLLLISGIDDLFLDLYYWFFRIVYPKRINRYRLEDPKLLEQSEEKPIAMFIPAWHEYDVIDRMLLNACRTLQYSTYDIFVGVYPNDPRTIAKVEEVAVQYPHVHAIRTNHDGPSTKADNLNDLFQGLLRFENRTDKRYEIVVMHDAEDIIHPMSLKMHNYFIPTYDMVQLPVFPLAAPGNKIVHWTYADEFAENHSKDMVTRQLYSSFIPSAGVGTGYNRWLIEFAGTSFAQNIFRKSSLTEDYDIALRLAMGKANLLYLYRPFEINVCTQAYFPDRFWAAIRQKTRWLIGICLQSWKNVGWIGDIKFRFTLYRDRKALVTNVVNALAYFVFLYILMYELARLSYAGDDLLPPIVSTTSPIWPVLVINTGLMFWRFFHRALSVGRIYGWAQGLMSMLRFPIGNLINSFATVRGITQFAVAVFHDRTVQWDKTSHTFPSEHPAPAGLQPIDSELQTSYHTSDLKQWPVPKRRRKSSTSTTKKRSVSSSKAS